jgi:hypothetical protein
VPTVEPNNGVVIEIHTKSYRTVRGRSLLCAVLDEVAFFRDDAYASPDTELAAALAPGLARIPKSMLILISSVHKRRGLLHYGANWVVDSFQRAGARYIQSDRDRSSVYMETLPIFTSGRARLLDNQRVISQFSALQRRTFSTGRSRIDPGVGHDDLCNSAAIAMSLADRVPKVQPCRLSRQ